MPPFQSTSGHHYVAFGSPWVGEVSLLQNDNSILDMPVGKVYLHHCPCCRLSQTPLNRTAPWSPDGQEVHPVCMRFLTGVCGFPTPYPPLPSHDVSACVLPENRAPSPHYTPCTESDSSDSPGTKIPIPSSFSHALPPTVSPSPGTGVRPFLLSSRS